MPRTPVLAVDIGGTKIAAALVDPDGHVDRHTEVPTPTTEADLATTLRGLLTTVAEDAHPSAVGLASAGPVDPVAGTVSPVTIPAWRDYPLVDLVRDIVPGVPVTLVGDAIAAAVGEHWRGAGDGVAAMLGIVVSTGIGGGLVLDGRPFTGPTGNAGHIGHMVVDPDGPKCPCGATGCVEAIASGPSMIRWARDHGWTGPDARALATDAHQGDPTATTTFDRGAKALAQAIAATATLCDLDRVVIGGGVSEAGDLLFGPLRHHLAQLLHLTYARRLTVRPASLGRHSGLLGAAHTALH